MKKLIYAPLAPLMLLAACGSNADNATGDAQPADDAGSMTATGNTENATASMDSGTAATDAIPTDGMGYVAKAGAGDMFEIESSKAAMAKSTNAGTKRFAQMMIDNHTASTAKVMAAAKAAKLTTTPPKLEPMQQQMLDEIKAADAAGVDAVYIKHQKTAHQAALALHEGYAANGDTEAFKKVAGEIAPVVKKHIAELDKMAAM